MMQALWCRRELESGVLDVPVRHCQRCMDFHAVNEFDDAHFRCGEAAHAEAKALAENVAAILRQEREAVEAAAATSQTITEDLASHTGRAELAMLDNSSVWKSPMDELRHAFGTLLPTMLDGL